MGCSASSSSTIILPKSVSIMGNKENGQFPQETVLAGQAMEMEELHKNELEYTPKKYILLASEYLIEHIKDLFLQSPPSKEKLEFGPLLVEVLMECKKYSTALNHLQKDLYSSSLVHLPLLFLQFLAELYHILQSLLNMISNEETFIWFSFSLGPPLSCLDYSSLIQQSKIRTNNTVQNCRSGFTLKTRLSIDNNNTNNHNKNEGDNTHCFKRTIHTLESPEHHHHSQNNNNHHFNLSLTMPRHSQTKISHHENTQNKENSSSRTYQKSIPYFQLYYSQAYKLFKTEMESHLSFLLVKYKRPKKSSQPMDLTKQLKEMLQTGTFETDIDEDEVEEEDNNNEIDRFQDYEIDFQEDQTFSMHQTEQSGVHALAVSKASQYFSTCHNGLDGQYIRNQ